MPVNRRQIQNIYRDIKPAIMRRMSEFKQIIEQGTERDLFTELTFCLCTPQSQAESCWAAVCRLRDKQLLFNENDSERFHPHMKGVRFHITKSGRIIEARKRFSENGEVHLRNYLLADTPKNVRAKIVKDVKGLGWKEASHFLRNIGLGEGLSILDRHILRSLTALGVINEIPKSLAAPLYQDIESRMAAFSTEVDIPLSHMDFVLWHSVKGDIFK